MGRWPAFPLALGLLLLGSGATLAATDLRSLLAEPPASDWVEYGPAARVLSGPFTAHDYATYLSTVNATPSTQEQTLVSYGFLAGYARDWEQQGTKDLLVERVFQFQHQSGAIDWYSDLERQNTTSQYTTRPISGLDQIPAAFGVVLTFPDGDHAYRVEFVKGNLVFVVHMDSYTNDLSSTAAVQALIEYKGAPALSARGSTGPDRSVLIVGGVAIAGVVLLTVLILVVLVLVGPWRRQPVSVAPQPVQLSPDGQYWWDGTSWRPTNQGG